MFELIGMAVVAWIVWRIGKSIVGGLIKGTLLRAASYAENLGVPSDFTNEMIARPDLLKQVRRTLASGDRDFAALDVFEQYGQALAALYSAKNEVDAELVGKLQNFLQNQIDTLAHEESTVTINDITVYYILHLAMMIAKKPVSLKEVGSLMRNVFTDERSVEMIDDTLISLGRNETRQRHGLGEDFDESLERFADRRQTARHQTEVKMAALLPIVKMEYEAGYGEFLIRHTRKRREDTARLFTERIDFSNVPDWTAKDLA